MINQNEYHTRDLNFNDYSAFPQVNLDFFNNRRYYDSSKKKLIIKSKDRKKLNINKLKFLKEVFSWKKKHYDMLTDIIEVIRQNSHLAKDVLQMIKPYMSIGPVYLKKIDVDNVKSLVGKRITMVVKDCLSLNSCITHKIHTIDVKKIDIS